MSLKRILLKVIIPPFIKESFQKTVDTIQNYQLYLIFK